MCIVTHMFSAAQAKLLLEVKKNKTGYYIENTFCYIYVNENMISLSANKKYW